jgi:hypothetical protein
VSEEFKDSMDVNIDDMLDEPLTERHHKSVKYKRGDRLDVQVRPQSTEVAAEDTITKLELEATLA